MNKYIYADKFFLKSAVHGPGYLEVKEENLARSSMKSLLVQT